MFADARVRCRTHGWQLNALRLSHEQDGSDEEEEEEKQPGKLNDKSTAAAGTDGTADEHDAGVSLPFELFSTAINWIALL